MRPTESLSWSEFSDRFAVPHGAGPGFPWGHVGWVVSGPTGDRFITAVDRELETVTLEPIESRKERRVHWPEDSKNPLALCGAMQDGLRSLNGYVRRPWLDFSK